jgi:hypothetical protein
VMIRIDEGMAPAVRFEACAAYRIDPGCPWQTCAGCGRLEDDHGLEDALVGSVVELRGEPVPLRRAS